LPSQQRFLCGTLDLKEEDRQFTLFLLPHLVQRKEVEKQMKEEVVKKIDYLYEEMPYQRLQALKE